MGSGARTRIQLCGRFVLELDGRRIEARLPSRQGRLLFAYLALSRDRAATRDELVDALWPYATPAAAPSALTVLVSKLRAALGPEVLGGRTELRLNLPRDARIDVEDCLAAIHEAQSANEAVTARPIRGAHRRRTGVPSERSPRKTSIAAN